MGKDGPVLTPPPLVAEDSCSASSRSSYVLIEDSTSEFESVGPSDALPTGALTLPSWDACAEPITASAQPSLPRINPPPRGHEPSRYCAPAVNQWRAAPPAGPLVWDLPLSAALPPPSLPSPPTPPAAARAQPATVMAMPPPAPPPSPYGYARPASPRAALAGGLPTSSSPRPAAAAPPARAPGFADGAAGARDHCEIRMPFDIRNAGRVAGDAAAFAAPPLAGGGYAGAGCGGFLDKAARPPQPRAPSAPHAPAAPAASPLIVRLGHASAGGYRLSTNGSSPTASTGCIDRFHALPSSRETGAAMAAPPRAPKGGGGSASVGQHNPSALTTIFAWLTIIIVVGGAALALQDALHANDRRGGVDSGTRGGMQLWASTNFPSPLSVLRNTSGAGLLGARDAQSARAQPPAQHGARAAQVRTPARPPPSADVSAPRGDAPGVRAHGLRGRRAPRPDPRSTPLIFRLRELRELRETSVTSVGWRGAWPGGLLQLSDARVGRAWRSVSRVDA